MHSREMGTGLKDRIYPLKEINLEMVFEENRGMKVLAENATTLRDFYRGGIQEKEDEERLLKEEKWEEAVSHFIESDRFLEVVVDYLPNDEPYRNIYGDHYITYIPNLLIADTQLNLTKINKKLKMSSGDIYRTVKKGRGYLARSLRYAKTEWAFQIKRELKE